MRFGMIIRFREFSECVKNQSPKTVPIVRRTFPSPIICPTSICHITIANRFMVDKILSYFESFIKADSLFSWKHLELVDGMS